MTILVTGGAGFIGSHTVVALLEAGYDVVVVDNLSNSSEESLKRIRQLTGKKSTFYQLDLCSQSSIDDVFNKHAIDAVIHFAGLKAVGESVEKALRYYQNNLISTLNLLDAMKRHNVKKLVFSSSATVYGNPEALPITETARRYATNPYGQTKLMIEQILEDVTATQEKWNITSLRYFNPVGAHRCGRIGEDPSGIPNNLLPFVSQVAVGLRDKVRIFGGDYDTIDGTGVRDYIHVVDLAEAHVAALRHLNHPDYYKAYNIGTGQGTSVLEIITAFANVSKKKIPYEVVDRRPGDIAACYADVNLAKQELEWSAQRTVDEMCANAWRWQSQNPNGYKK